MSPGPDGDFIGAKAALFLGDRLAVIRRDDFAGLPWRGCLDFPGGGREGDETPDQTLAREVMEELGLPLDAADWLWRRAFPALTDPARIGWFFVLRLPAAAAGRVRFGDEGQGWALMTPADFLGRRDAVPALQDRLRVWMSLG